MPLVAVMSLGAGAGETGLLAAMQSLPFLLLSLPAGLLADRFSRARLVAGAEIVRAAVLLAVPACLVFGALSVPLLAAVGFLAATGTVVFSVAVPSLVPALVARDDLARANGRLELARSLAFAAGPALAGALVAWVGVSPAFAGAVALSGVAFLLLARLPEPPRAAMPRRPVLHDLMEGADFAWSHALIRPILLTAVAWNMSWFVLQAAYVPYAVHRLGLNTAEVGKTLAMFGVGMVSGVVLAPRIARIVSFGLSIALGPLVSVAAALVMAASIWLPPTLLPGAVMPAIAFFLFGFGPILWTISQTTLRQAVTPAAMLGRVSALVMMATAGARPLGAAIGGVVGAGYGPEFCLVLAALGFAVQAGVIMASPVPRLAHLPEGACA
ncbi:MAG: MFS transporter [Alphaproteobacteria bacterium]|nr:MFS transporter [Alphaproteobacteria bacterium]